MRILVDGLEEQSRDHIDNAAVGNIGSLHVDAAFQLIDKIARTLYNNGRRDDCRSRYFVYASFSEEDHQKKIQDAVKEAVAEQFLKLNMKIEPEPAAQAPVMQVATQPSYPAQQPLYSAPPEGQCMAGPMPDI